MTLTRDNSVGDLPAPILDPLAHVTNDGKVGKSHKASQNKKQVFVVISIL